MKGALGWAGGRLCVVPQVSCPWGGLAGCSRAKAAPVGSLVQPVPHCMQPRGRARCIVWSAQRVRGWSRAPPPVGAALAVARVAMGLKRLRRLPLGWARLGREWNGHGGRLVLLLVPRLRGVCVPRRVPPVPVQGAWPMGHASLVPWLH